MEIAGIHEVGHGMERVPLQVGDGLLFGSQEFAVNQEVPLCFGVLEQGEVRGREG